MVFCTAVAAYIAVHLVASVDDLCEGLFTLFGLPRLEQMPSFRMGEERKYRSGDKETISGRAPTHGFAITSIS